MLIHTCVSRLCFSVFHTYDKFNLVHQCNHSCHSADCLSYEHFSFSVTEGAYLYNEGINPYVGDNFHETPLGLIVFDKMINHIPQWIGIIFVVCDIVTAHVLYHTAQTFMSELVG